MGKCVFYWEICIPIIPARAKGLNYASSSDAMVTSRLSSDVIFWPLWPRLTTVLNLQFICFVVCCIAGSHISVLSVAKHPSRPVQDYPKIQLSEAARDYSIDLDDARRKKRRRGTSAH